jgi:hypothetical protein
MLTPSMQQILLFLIVKIHPSAGLLGNKWNVIKPRKKVNAGSLEKPDQHLAGCLGFPIHKKNAILLYGI